MMFWEVINKNRDNSLSFKYYRMSYISKVIMHIFFLRQTEHLKKGILAFGI